MVDIGEPAPDFMLTDQNGDRFILSDYRGRRIILSFHPLAWTSTCTEQMKGLEKHWQEFDALNTIAVGISVDSVPCKKAWARDMGLEMTTLLADFWPHGGVAQEYATFDGEKGVAYRANIIVDEFQRIMFTKRYEPSEKPNITELIAALREQDSGRVEDLQVPKI